eukprot:TRINITY_DN238_c0_g1_i6.p1 TRINITY_DN238_c0_g1~~TRINITY_DN238_c0_g1_i6.p1  ORF type:complete len:407 (+),score=67.81 TRINITY_DN238_c0_g1_i6:145-1221(+)
MACSRLLMNRAGSPVVSARTMDWFNVPHFGDLILVNPRGQLMDGGLANSSSSMVWTSKYGSIVASIHDWAGNLYSSHTREHFDFEKDGAIDGLNEKGLAAHMLGLEVTGWAPVPSQPVGVTYLRWTRYLLDTCASVEEAVAAMKLVQISDVLIGDNADGSGHSFRFHMAVEDPSGDSAIFEIINGSVEVYHSKNLTVLTDDPPLPWQLENLLKYESFGGDLPVPGDISGGDRFVRAMYFLKHMSECQDADYMVRLMKTAAVEVASPRGAPYPCKTQACIELLDGFGDFDHSMPTLWTSVIDVSRQVYHRGHENFWKIDLKELASSGKLDKGAPILVMNSTRYAIVEDVTDEFHPNVLV